MLEVFTITLDGILLLAATATGVVAWRTLRGGLSVGITVACAGLVALGFAHLSETLFGIYLNFVGEGPPEIVHRGLVLGGFALLCLGLARVGVELHREIRALADSNAELATAQDDLRLSNEELRERNRQLVDARVTAATDGLTGLLNHRSFHEEVRAAVSPENSNDAAVGLIMMDLDGFKSVNDNFGHLAGDEVLRQVAIAIQVVCKDFRTYRYGGDEFGVLLPGHDEEQTVVIAERVRVAILSAISTPHQVTVSSGVAAFPSHAGTAEELIYGADAAMYWAKSAGKNQVARWSDLHGHRERLVAAAQRSQLLRIA